MSASKQGAGDANIDDSAEAPAKQVKKGVMVTNCSVDELTQPAETTAECIATKLTKFNKKYKPDQHSNKGICGLQVKTWCSKVYTHFVMPPTIMMMDLGDISYQFVCKLDLL